MDNFRFDMTSIGLDHLKLALLLVSNRKKVWGYQVDKEKGLVLFWYGSDKAIPLPSLMPTESCLDLITNWLSGADYGREPDLDGDAKRGFRVYNEDWGHINGDYRAFAAVQPAWALYGK